MNTPPPPDAASETPQASYPPMWAVTLANSLVYPGVTSGEVLGQITIQNATIIDIALTAKLAAMETALAQWKDCAEYGWTIIANASGGNWKRESEDWQKAAAKFRDENYYPCLRLNAQLKGRAT